MGCAKRSALAMALLGLVHARSPADLAGVAWRPFGDDDGDLGKRSEPASDIDDDDHRQRKVIVADSANGVLAFDRPSNEEQEEEAPTKDDRGMDVELLESQGHEDGLCCVCPNTENERSYFTLTLPCSRCTWQNKELAQGEAWRTFQYIHPPGELNHSGCVEQAEDEIRNILDVLGGEQAAKKTQLDAVTSKRAMLRCVGDRECSTCFGNVSAEDNRAVCPQCGAAFHVECLRKWVAGQKKKDCPNCRGELPDQFVHWLRNSDLPPPEFEWQDFYKVVHELPLGQREQMADEFGRERAELDQAWKQVSRDIDIGRLILLPHFNQHIDLTSPQRIDHHQIEESDHDDDDGIDQENSDGITLSDSDGIALSDDDSDSGSYTEEPTEEQLKQARAIAHIMPKTNRSSSALQSTFQELWDVKLSHEEVQAFLHRFDAYIQDSIGYYAPHLHAFRMTWSDALTEGFKALERAQKREIKPEIKREVENENGMCCLCLSTVAYFSSTGLCLFCSTGEPWRMFKYTPKPPGELDNSGCLARAEGATQKFLDEARKEQAKLKKQLSHEVAERTALARVSRDIDRGVEIASQIARNAGNTEVQAGGFHTAAIGSDGQMHLWGRNDYHQVRGKPELKPGITWRSVAAGGGHTAGIASDGQLYVWGSNQYNQTRGKPELEEFLTWRSVAAGSLHTAAIASDGQLHLWGYDGHDKRVTGKPELKAGVTWQSVSVGREHTAAIDSDGQMHLWGSDYLHKVQGKPALKLGLTWRSVAAGSDHTAGIASDGQLYVWGWDLRDLVSRKPKCEPGRTWRSVAVGHVAAGIDNNDQLYFWGKDDYRQVPSESALAGLTWRSVAVGSMHTAAIDNNGQLHLWGENGDKQVTDVPAGLTWR